LTNLFGADTLFSATGATTRHREQSDMSPDNTEELFNSAARSSGSRETTQRLFSLVFR
jgi:hypothetical protein